MKLFFCFSLSLLFLTRDLPAQIEYPYPVNYIRLTIENKSVKMAFMDVKAEQPNGRTIILFHGKNFNGYYWKNIIPFFTQHGFRVLIPDQVGWGRSEKPIIQYSFHGLAYNNKILLDSLGLNKVIVIGHSMGGMLAIRFSLMYPQTVEKLILENPIGLEDYKTFVPYQATANLYSKERKASYESYKKYQQGYFPEWKPGYEQYVAAQAAELSSPDFDQVAWVNAFTYQMIYEQPVVYEMDHLVIPVLLIIGQSDRTIVGKDQLTEEQKSQYGQYPLLGRLAKQAIKNAILIGLPGIGHIPHLQDLSLFEKSILPFLTN
jgi:pimeloyl-ACP methyl ester carboxylesterase